MRGERLRRARLDAGWTQRHLAARLGVAQAYVSLMESGKRRVPNDVARRVTHLLRMPATDLPFADFEGGLTNSKLANELARLGYPELAYRQKPGALRNPAGLLLGALALDALEARLAEALPWLLLTFHEFDCEALVVRAKARDLQNRLGFTVALARTVAEQNPMYQQRVDELRAMEEVLEPSRLAREDTLGSSCASERMRAWVRDNRSDAARHWNLLTDLKAEHLPYAGHSGTVVELRA